METTSVSIPLPLPVHFTLLPSRIPGKSLTPLLYSLINDVPVYTTLSPSHQPHFSLLPLLLSLKPPIPPLHILTSLRLTSKDYSTDLDGVAPFIDIWVPWSTARNVCEKLKVDILFWSASNTSKGLLSETVKDAVSWDEGVTIGHNWIPSVSHIPPSSYSLAKLLDTPFPSLSIIPDDRCISTAIDPARRAHILSEAEHGDPSQIRQGQWGKTWGIIVRLNVIVWNDFLLHPSKPPRDQASSSSPDDLPSLIHDLIPTMGQLGRATILSSPSFTPVLPDLCDILRLNPFPPAPNLLSLLLASTRRLLRIVSPFKSFELKPSPEDFGQLQVRARLALGVVEAISMTLMTLWTVERENARLSAQFNGGTSPPLIVINSASSLDSPPVVKPAASASNVVLPSPSTTRKRRRRLNGIHLKDSGHRQSQVEGWHEASLDELERRRGGSPLSSDSSLTPLQKTARPTDRTWTHSVVGLTKPAPSSRSNSEMSPQMRSTRDISPTTYIRRAVNGPASHASVDEKIDKDAGESVEEYEDPEEELIGAMQDGGEIVRELVLQSENWHSLWIYFGAFGVLAVVLGLGRTG